MPRKVTTALEVGDTTVQTKLGQGLILKPYWGQSKDGRRIWCSAWVRP